MEEYKAAIYCRTCFEDEHSIHSVRLQREMLTQYCRKHSFIIGGTYTDKCYSGIDSNRPALNQMIEDISKGSINCVITKDISRLGRDSKDVIAYICGILNENNIRFIAVDNNIDTLYENPFSVFAAFYNIKGV